MPTAIKIALFIALSALSGRFYRMGGEDGSWHGKERDWGCSLCLIACLWLFNGWSWLYFPTFLFSWLALSAYWKGKAVDMKWHHWAMHGAGCGLAALPLIWAGVTIQQIVYRAVFCCIAMTAVSEFSDDVEYEEFMRGAIFTSSVVFLI